jgi:hypothetical protein
MNARRVCLTAQKGTKLHLFRSFLSRFAPTVVHFHLGMLLIIHDLQYLELADFIAVTCLLCLG